MKMVGKRLFCVDIKPFNIRSLLTCSHSHPGIYPKVFHLSHLAVTHCRSCRAQCPHPAFAHISADVPTLSAWPMPLLCSFNNQGTSSVFALISLNCNGLHASHRRAWQQLCVIHPGSTCYIYMSNKTHEIRKRREETCTNLFHFVCAQ